MTDTNAIDKNGLHAAQEAWKRWGYTEFTENRVKQLIKTYLANRTPKLADGWKPGTDRGMRMLHKRSAPLLFQTTIHFDESKVIMPCLHLGYYDERVEAFVEDDRPGQRYRESVDCWFQPPVVPSKYEM